jgi:uncharacterized membrane protein YfbV (UPF0208 family)
MFSRDRLLLLLIIASILFVDGTPSRNATRTFRHYTRWTAEEDAKLLELVDQHKGNPKMWTEISKVLERNPLTIHDHYTEHLDPKLKSSHAEWTEEEYRIVLQEIQETEYLKRRPRYAQIARQLNRSRLAVNNLKDSIKNEKTKKLDLDKKHVWTAEEDAKILELYDKHNGSRKVWTDISHVLNEKPSVIKYHYTSRLDRNFEKTNSKWTEEEDNFLLEEWRNAKVLKRRPRWEEIAISLKRSQKSIANRWRIIHKRETGTNKKSGGLQ